MTPLRWSWLATGVLLAACRSDKGSPPPSANASGDVAPPAASAVVDPGSAAKAELASAVGAFDAGKTAAPAQRVDAILRVGAAVDQARAFADVTPYDKPAWRQGVRLAKEFKALEAEESAAAANEPARMEPPKLVLPEYAGAQRLVGTYRGPHAAGGIVVEASGKYYLIEDGAQTEASVLHGYVDDTGREVVLDIGRTGRTAAVVTLSDKESYRDDQNAHRDAVASAQREFAEAQQAYQRSLAENGVAIAAAKKARTGREARRRATAAALEATLRGIDSGQLEAAPPAPTASPVAPATAAGAAPKAPPVDRATCLRACIGRCAGDAGCERACATTTCR